MAMPVYTMNVFKLPKRVYEEINSALGKFWWSKKGGQRSMHWFSWDRLSVPKQEGGLGFRDLENFNLALLGKQIWRILQAPTSLVARFLKARYFPDSNIFNARNGNKSSFIWKSLLEGRDLLKKGMRFLIGNGQITSILADPWLPTNPPRPPMCREGIVTDLKYVSELMFDEQPYRWNMELIEELFVEEDNLLIQQLKLGPTDCSYLLGWHYTDSGFYNVKSGYWLACNLPTGNNKVREIPGSPTLKRAIWKIQTAPKIQHFL
ncbi:PREDICTED: uncharacterized protein LOC109128735 [Camelina sativa]|uniref:Uncharacterized protein LOC109128735 n=1 Tax=Camelina sativa TaxID=90675 RepID=A0ABM1QWK4_CAMSA|nr:PREDICTED: uncharacterized protein LOC109128735 [Camelina sativa]